ncbi:MAG: GtrA family protein [Candidatus Dormibacteraeota bacterium]|nr:GtrA family protein [Candidatus Dormibacteraeota bacterium]
MSALSPAPLDGAAGARIAAWMRWWSSAGAFGLVGLSGIAVNQALLAALVSGARLNYLVAAVLASAGSSTCNFLLTERWVFRGRRRGGAMRRFLGYSALTLGSTPLRLPILYVLTSLHGVHYLLSNLVAIVAVFGGRYLVSDLLIWRQHVTPNLEVNVTE